MGWRSHGLWALRRATAWAGRRVRQALSVALLCGLATLPGPLSAHTPAAIAGRPHLRPHVVLIGVLPLPHVTTGTAEGAGPCAAIDDAPSPHARGAISMAGLEDIYGVDSIHASGDLGAGSGIAVIEFAPFLWHEVAAYRRCIGATTRISRLAVNGGATSSGSATTMGEVESELDIETLSALAPAAHLYVIDARESSYDDILDAYRAAVGTGAKVIVTTWGSCEATVVPAFQSAEAVLFQQAADQGTTVVAAAGDDGSQDCALARSELSVDDPASQPEVTGVGGVTMEDGSGLAVWNDGPGEAGGGGISATFSMPGYQERAAAPQRKLTPATPCDASSCREVPDVAADAGTPVAIACDVPGTCDGIALTGGTSLAAPVWAALFALADASPSCAGHPIGLANPALYAIAAGPRAGAAFVDITSGNNDPVTTAAPRYRAHRGFDLASGLGAPKAAGRFGLVAQLCSYARGE